MLEFILCCYVVVFFFFKQKTAYEMLSGDWSSDVCSSDLDIEQTKKIDQIRANFLGVNVNLNASSGVAKIEEVALPHVAMRSDAASRAQELAIREFFAHLRDCSIRFERSVERFDPLRAQRVEFFSSQRDQFILFIHPWHSLPGYRRISISQAACLCHKEMNSLDERQAKASA